MRTAMKSSHQSTRPPLWKGLLWMLLLWLASVLALSVVSLLLRLLMRAAGLESL